MNFLDLIGNTPLVTLEEFGKRQGLKAEILAKLESFNLAGSVKDRIARAMIEEAERAGTIKKGDLLIEPTSGNTGIAISAIGALCGYHVCIVMPETMSIERRKLILAYGAELVLTEGARGMKGAIEKAAEIQKERGGHILGQFDNPANPYAHYTGTGPEIYRDTAGKADFLVAGIGTGGTVTGAGKYLKEKIEGFRVIGVEPASSPVLTKGVSGKHKIQGIGAGFVPRVLDSKILDEVIDVTDEEAFAMGRELAKFGCLVGISSGAALAAAVQVAKRPENEGKRIVVILPDGGTKYLSTEYFA